MICRLQVNITHNFSNFKSDKKTILTIGTFDGVHIGHQEIIKSLVNEAREKNCAATLLTFFPHPRMVLQKNADIKLIHTIDEKSEELERLGLDELIIHPFDVAFSRLSAFEFVRDILINQLNISKLIIGHDHRFGKNREGTFEQLQEYGNIFDFELEEIPAQTLDDVSISSTKIRNALFDGNIERANSYLGTNFSIKGRVVKGNNIGNTIGFPTANIHIKEDYKLVPKSGAYIVKSKIYEKEFFGMMNIGNRPTVNGKNMTIEVNFFDFNQNIYDEFIEIEFLKFLRPEQKFDSIQNLAQQLEKDKLTAIDFIKSTF